MYPTFTNNNASQDAVSVYSGNSTNTNSSFSCRGGAHNPSRMIPRSNSTSDLFDIPLQHGTKAKKRKHPPYAISPEIARINGRFMSSNASLASRDKNNNYVTSKGHEQHNQSLKAKAKLFPQDNSTYPQKKPHSHSCNKSQGVPLQHSHQDPNSKTFYAGHVRPLKDSGIYLASNSRLNPILEGTQFRRPLTPYEMQRKQMKKSFQFPNGENFTPKNRSVIGLSRLDSANPKDTQRTMSNASRSNSLAMINPGAQAALHSLSRSQSTSSVTLKYNASQPLVKMNGSPVTSGSSSSSYNSMREHASNDSTDPSSEPSTNSSATGLSPPPKGPLKPISIIQCKPVPIRPTAPQIRSTKNNMHSMKASDSLPNNVMEKAQGPSKWGTFFKKMFSPSTHSFLSRKKKLIAKGNEERKLKKKDVDIVCSASPSELQAETPATLKQMLVDVSASIPIHESSSKDNEIGNLNKKDEQVNTKADENDDDDDYDDDDNILMDTDLVFDSLLLKADEKHLSAVNKQKDLAKKLSQSDTTKNDDNSTKEIDVRAHKEEGTLDPQLDYDLISDFSKLGSIINQFPTLPDPQADVSLKLPLRSNKRPVMTNKDSIRSFYQTNRHNTEYTSRLLERLNQEWTLVHLDQSIKSSLGQGVSMLKNRQLRFSGSIYVNDTWSPHEYERCDKKFIKNRRRMMQLENERFVQAIKFELNEYKRNDMIVHQDSAQYTHFFL